MWCLVFLPRECSQHFQIIITHVFFSFQIIYLKKTPEEAYKPLVGGNSPQFCPFRDAAYGMSTYHLTLLDCLHAIDKAFKLGFFNFDDFDVDEYEYYEVRDAAAAALFFPFFFIFFSRSLHTFHRAYIFFVMHMVWI